MHHCSLSYVLSATVALALGSTLSSGTEVLASQQTVAFFASPRSTSPLILQYNCTSRSQRKFRQNDTTNARTGEDFRPGYLGNYSDTWGKGDPRASAFYDEIFAHIRAISPRTLISAYRCVARRCLVPYASPTLRHLLFPTGVTSAQQLAHSVSSRDSD
eukprot:SAG11_NODE_1667_length_4494_cov_5.922412_3_plen_159_part_00